MVEICSEATGAGKTQLIYYFIAIAILPDVHDAALLGGKNGAVVFIDTDSRFDVERLVQVMTCYIASRTTEEDPVADVQGLIERTLQHVHVFQPRTMDSLLATLSELKDYLFDFSAHSSSNRAVHNIVLDSASAFYWETRAALETDRINALDVKAPGASAAAMPPPKPNPYALLVNRLRSLQQTLNCAVIATSTARSYKDSVTGEQVTSTLPAPWASFPTTKIMVKREQVRKFTLGISWEDAEKDKMLRQAAVEQGQSVATALSGGKSFRFAITIDGVRMLDEAKELEEEDEETVADESATL